MTKSMVIIAIAMSLSLGGLSYAEPAEPAAQPGAETTPSTAAVSDSKSVKGEVLKIEGENYVVKDQAGKEVSMQVNQDTKTDGHASVGDRIEAEVITRLRLPFR